MSRLSYCDEESFDGQFALWNANVNRSIRGLKGQEALHALESALLAMPEKRLIRNVLVDDEGSMCTLGALVVAIRTHRGDPIDAVREELRTVDPDDSEATIDEATALGVPSMVAWRLVALNDMDLETEYVTAEGPSQHTYFGEYRNQGVPYIRDITPEERYTKVLAWVQKRLIKGGE